MKVTSPPASADRVARQLRTGLIACGVSVTVFIGAALTWRVSRGGIAGPTQVDIMLAGLCVAALGLLRSPARFIAASLVVAREARPVLVAPVTPRQRLTLAAIVLLALGFRVVMVDVYWPTHQIVSGMPLWDAEMARNLLKGRGWMLNWAFVQRQDRAIVERGVSVDPEDFLPVDDSQPGTLDKLQYIHTPGYSIWLATSFALGRSHRFIYSQWMQAALDAMACLLVFGIGRRLWSASAGIAGALMYSVSPGLVYLAIQPVAAATDSFWVLLVGYGIVRLAIDVGSGTFPRAGLIAVVAGAFCGTVMNTLSFTLALATAGVALLIGFRFRSAWRIAAYLVAAHVIVSLLLVPWGLRNQREYGYFAEMRQSFWQHTWETLGAIPNPWDLVLNTAGGGKDDAYEKWVAETCPGTCGPIERETFTRDYILKTVVLSRQFPGHMLRLVAMQLPGIVYVSRLPAENPYVGSGAAGKSFAAILRVLNVAVLLLWPAAALGLVLVTLRQSTALAAWCAIVPSIFLIAFSLCLFVEHRKTTQAYGYLTALAGIAAAGYRPARR